MKSRTDRGFSLAELLIVVGCLMLILVPSFRILQMGTRSSLQGMLRVDTTLEARRILRQIQKDLKASCFPISVGSAGELSIDSILKTSEPVPQEYVFFAFPSLGSPEQFVKEGPLIVNRQVSKIRYLLRKGGNPGKPFQQLIREEWFSKGHPLAAEFPGGCRRSILSERVNFFRISPREFQTPAPYFTHSVFWITLQLVDSLKAGTLDGESPGETWKTPAPGLVLADFYDVVYPEFFNSLQDWSFMNRNWYNSLEWQTP